MDTYLSDGCSVNYDDHGHFKLDEVRAFANIFDSDQIIFGQNRPKVNNRLTLITAISLTLTVNNLSRLDATTMAQMSQKASSTTEMYLLTTIIFE